MRFLAIALVLLIVSFFFGLLALLGELISVEFSTSCILRFHGVLISRSLIIIERSYCKVVALSPAYPIIRVATSR